MQNERWLLFFSLFFLVPRDTRLFTARFKMPDNTTPSLALNFFLPFSSTLWECESLQQSGLLFRVCLLIYCEALHLFTPVVLADPLMLPPSVVCCCAESQKMCVSSSVCFSLCPLHTHEEPTCSPTLH